MYGRRSTLAGDLLGGLSAAVTGYAGATWAKVRGPGNALLPVVAEGVVGLGSLIGRKFTDKPVLHEVLSGAGYGGFNYLGVFAAANTTTIGNKGAGPVPMGTKTGSGAFALRGGNPNPGPAAPANVAQSSGGSWEPGFDGE